MTRTAREGNRRTPGLLLLVQLLSFVLLPVLHARPVAAGVASSIDAHGSVPDAHHDASCTACRLAGSRFVPVPAVQPLPLATAAQQAAPPQRQLVVAPPALSPAAAPRAPPIAR